MASAEGSSNTEIIFRGIDGNECEAFVFAIREFAFVQGKDEDDRWMLRYTTTRLKGKALRWHAKLDPSVQKDWYLFVQALFEEYPPVEEPDQGGIATPVWASTSFSPAPSNITLPGNPGSQDISSLDTLHLPTAENAVRSSQQARSSSCACGASFTPSPRVYDPSEPGLRVGRLRIVYEEGRTCPQYVSQYRSSYNSDLRAATLNAQEALIVRFLPSSEPHEIACMKKGNGYSGKLAVQLSPAHLTEYHPLVDKSQYKRPVTESSWSFRQDTYCYQRVSQIWNVLDDGTLQASLANLTRDPNNKANLTVSGAYVTTAAYVDISGEVISFVEDYSPAHTLDPISQHPIVRVRILFEPL